VVDDWYEHGLSAPHPGNRWVQHGSDYVMVGTATGTIIELSLDSSDGEDRCDP
jgi:Ni/Co efflux regulator RcnB